jgi:hypothetical protein
MRRASLLTLRGKEAVVVDAHGQLHGRFLHLALRLQEVHVGLALGGIVLQVPPEGGEEGREGGREGGRSEMSIGRQF